jgi:N-acetylmuramoyl-L-alanine amidase
MYKISKILVLPLSFLITFGTMSGDTIKASVKVDTTLTQETNIQLTKELLFVNIEPNPIPTVSEPVEVVEEVIVEHEPTVYDLYSEDEIYLLALVMLAEAEGEPEEGQRLVVDTIMNRVDSNHFPDNIYDVVYQKGHFTSMWNGRTSRVTVTEESINIVIEELNARYNYDSVFFTAGHYGEYGEPMFSVGNHYFSSY